MPTIDGALRRISACGPCRLPDRPLRQQHGTHLKERRTGRAHHEHARTAEGANALFRTCSAHDLLLWEDWRDETTGISDVWARASFEARPGKVTHSARAPLWRSRAFDSRASMGPRNRQTSWRRFTAWWQEIGFIRAPRAAQPRSPSAHLHDRRVVCRRRLTPRPLGADGSSPSALAAS